MLTFLGKRFCKQRRTHSRYISLPEAFGEAVPAFGHVFPSITPARPPRESWLNSVRRRGQSYLSSQNVQGECRGSVVVSSSRCFFVMFSNSFSSMSMLFSADTVWPLRPPLSVCTSVWPAGTAIWAEWRRIVLISPPPCMKLRNKNTRLGFICSDRNTLPLFRLPTADVTASPGWKRRSWSIPESRGKKKRRRPHSDWFFWNTNLPVHHGRRLDNCPNRDDEYITPTMIENTNKREWWRRAKLKVIFVSGRIWFLNWVNLTTLGYHGFLFALGPCHRP